MLGKKNYANGQAVYTLEDGVLSYFYKDGSIKARGAYIDEKMEGLWEFFKEAGYCWQTGEFKGGIKEGKWIRFNEKLEVIYEESFINGKQNRVEANRFKD